MNKTLKAVLALSLILGLGSAGSANAASASPKPKVTPVKKTTPAPKGKEGTATHEMAEASEGSGEEGSKKVTKATTSVIKKQPTAKPSPTAKK
jgi:hypothetical protein